MSDECNTNLFCHLEEMPSLKKVVSNAKVITFMATFSNVSFGENLRRLREKRGLKGYQLAEMMGVGASQVSKWELGRVGVPEGPTLIKLAAKLGCTVDDLVAGVNSEYDQLLADARTESELASLELFSAFLTVRRASGNLVLEHAGWDALDEFYRETSRAHMLWSQVQGRPTDDNVADAFADAVAKSQKAREILQPLLDSSDVPERRSLTKVTEYLPVIEEGTISSRDLWDPAGDLAESVNEKIVRPPDLSDPSAYGVRIVSNDMTPAYRLGAVVIVSPAAVVERDCAVYAILENEPGIVRLATYIPDRSSWLLWSPSGSTPFSVVSNPTLHRIVWTREPLGQSDQGAEEVISSWIAKRTPIRPARRKSEARND
jgi:transcriptional regulator with XRE-family HTH domain